VSRRKTKPTHQLQLLPRVVNFETQQVSFERDKSELELLNVEGAKYSEVGKSGGAESSHSRDDEEVVRMLVSLRHCLDLLCQADRVSRSLR
jgi:hypothetical protein